MTGTAKVFQCSHHMQETSITVATSIGSQYLLLYDGELWATIDLGKSLMQRIVDVLESKASGVVDNLYLHYVMDDRYLEGHYLEGFKLSVIYGGFGMGTVAAFLDVSDIGSMVDTLKVLRDRY
jgi:hypothetical protein